MEVLIYLKRNGVACTCGGSKKRALKIQLRIHNATDRKAICLEKIFLLSLELCRSPRKAVKVVWSNIQ